ncbi:hypothetical protein B0H11DRAFT_1921442 [Mycena galericulata]|nr:hypothetical protein B0H11DRAFT_1921442 [Mycena galericulata]
MYAGRDLRGGEEEDGEGNSLQRLSLELAGVPTCAALRRGRAASVSDENIERVAPSLLSAVRFFEEVSARANRIRHTRAQEGRLGGVGPRADVRQCSIGKRSAAERRGKEKDGAAGEVRWQDICRDCDYLRQPQQLHPVSCAARYASPRSHVRLLRAPAVLSGMGAPEVMRWESEETTTRTRTRSRPRAPAFLIAPSSNSTACPSLFIPPLLELALRPHRWMRRRAGVEGAGVDDAGVGKQPVKIGMKPGPRRERGEAEARNRGSHVGEWVVKGARGYKYAVPIFLPHFSEPKPQHDAVRGSSDAGGSPRVPYPRGRGMGVSSSLRRGSVSAGGGAEERLVRGGEEERSGGEPERERREGGEGIRGGAGARRGRLGKCVATRRCSRVGENLGCGVRRGG